MTQNSTNTNILVPRIIWLALCTSILLYVFVAFMVTKSEINFSLQMPDTSDPLVIPLLGMSLVTALLAWQFPTFFKSNGLKRDVNSFRTNFVIFIIRMALLESITIYGLIIALQTHNGNQILPFVIVTLVGFFFCFPRNSFFCLE